MKKDTYKTRDLAESSFLIAKGKNLRLIEREGKICWFIFDDKEICEQIANDFWFGDSIASAKAFYDAMQTLKNRIFA